MEENSLKEYPYIVVQIVFGSERKDLLHLKHAEHDGLIQDALRKHTGVVIRYDDDKRTAIIPDEIATKCVFLLGKSPDREDDF